MDIIAILIGAGIGAFAAIPVSLLLVALLREKRVRYNPTPDLYGVPRLPTDAEVKKHITDKRES